jgi:anti-sigma-K factor RskA
MTTDAREERELNAAEYALGTMTGEERARFEEALRSDAELRAAVDRWNARLAPLAEAVAPVAPSPGVWRRIEAMIGVTPPAGATSGATSRLGLWRWSALAAGALAAVLALYIALAPSRDKPGYVALLNDSQARPVVMVTVDARAARIAVRPVVALAPGDKALELWLVPKQGAPKSLGVIRADEPVERAVPAALGPAFPTGAALAVSLEPLGGSPTGLPTGPVVYSGPLVVLAR